MSKVFKINKEEIIDRLSKVEGVKAINMSIPDEVYPEYEGVIQVLYEPQQGETYSVLSKSLELVDMACDLVESPDMDLHISIRTTNKPRVFYGPNNENKNKSSIVEVS